MVLHGGLQGELTLYGMPTEYVQDWTREELQSDRIDIGGGERIPTLLQLIQLCEGKDDMLLNIELKGPKDPEIAKKYDFALAAKLVVDMINEHNIGFKTQVSSFRYQFIDALLELQKTQGRSYMLQCLKHEQEDTRDGTDGVTTYIPSLTSEYTH